MADQLSDASAAAPHTPKEQAIADLLRMCEFAMHHARTALVAFVAPQYVEAIGRDYERLQYVEKMVGEALLDLPPALPLTPEQEAEARAVILRALDRIEGGVS